MKVVHGPSWLKSIEWYYEQYVPNVPHYDTPSSPVNYIQKRNVTYITLLLKLRHSLTQKRARYYRQYVTTDCIKNALANLGEEWSFEIEGSTKIILTGKFKGIVENFHNIPLAITRKLRKTTANN